MSELTIHTMQNRTDYPANQNMLAAQKEPKEWADIVSKRFDGLLVSAVWHYAPEGLSLIPVEWTHIPMTYRIDDD